MNNRHVIKRVTKDFETRSQVDLKKHGAYYYSLDPSTKPTCLAFKIHGNPKVYFLDYEKINRQWVMLPQEFRSLWIGLINDEYEFTAHNSFFERCIYDNILVARYNWPPIEPTLRRCTAAKAASCALPRSLDGVGEALKLSIQKDRRGYAAMMATCKPTKQYKAWQKAVFEVKNGKRVGAKKLLLSKQSAPPMFLEPEDSPEIWNTLYTYCKIDVRTEELLDTTLPDLSPQEQKVWHLNQKLNWRGIRVDIPVTQKIVDLMESESTKKLQELDKLTMGLVTKPGARKSILDFLELDGIILPDIRAKTIQDELEGFSLTDDARALLEIRKALSKTSTKKYQSFLNRAVHDNRIRDIQLYHGASTGRDSGSGIQIQNFPRRLIPQKEVEYVLEMFKDSNTEGIIEWVEYFYGNASMVFSSLLRSMILPTKGYELFVADFSKIEVAVLWWLSDNVPGLKILRENRDPYKYMAAVNTGKPYDEIEDEGDARQLGKAQILGCGFGMGAPKFKTTAWDMFRLKLTDEQSKLAVQNYRNQNSAVPILWKAYEQAAISVTKNGEGSITYAGKCKFFIKDKFLWVELPSRRRLAYREPQLSWRETDYGPRQTLEFWAVNSKTKKWSLERSWGGTLAENITQAVARDLLMYGMLRLEKTGYDPLFSVHDELICQKLIGQGNIDEYSKILCEVPTWGVNMPIEAKGWVGPRYRK